MMGGGSDCTLYSSCMLIEIDAIFVTLYNYDTLIHIKQRKAKIERKIRKWKRQYLNCIFNHELKDEILSFCTHDNICKEIERNGNTIYMCLNCGIDFSIFRGHFGVFQITLDECEKKHEYLRLPCCKYGSRFNPIDI